MDVLKQRATSARSSKASHPRAEQQPAMTLYKAVEDFKKTKLEVEPSRSIRSRYRMAINHFLMNNKHGDIVLEFATLKHRIVEMRGVCKLSPDTMQKVLYKVSIICQYFVDNGWIERNPVQVIGIPKNKQEFDDTDIDDENVVIFKAKEVQDMTRWLRERSYPRVADLIEVLFMTGLRPIEALRMRWEHWDGNTFKIYGKRVKGNKTGVRYLPLYDDAGKEVSPGLLDKLNELRKDEEINEGFVFPWRSLSNIQRIVKQCRMALNLGPKLTLKALRPTANWVFREQLRWTREFRCEYLGHSVAVNKRHYDRRRTPEEVVRSASTRSISGSSGA